MDLLAGKSHRTTTARDIEWGKRSQHKIACAFCIQIGRDERLGIHEAMQAMNNMIAHTYSERELMAKKKREIFVQRTR
jgi:hypothetical protein